MSQKNKFVSLADLKKTMGQGVDEAPEAKGTVYSTEIGRTCPACGKAKDNCACGKSDEILGDGRVRVQRETKGRKGKGVTIISGLPVTAEKMKTICKQLKQACGVGGTVKQATIEIQGDHRDKVIEELIKLGYEAKKSGG